MTKRLLARRVRTAGVMLCSTAIAAVLAIGPQASAAEPAGNPASAKLNVKKKKPIAAADVRWKVPELLPPHIIRSLIDAQRNGPHDLIAGVFDHVRERPGTRHAVLDYARGLAPALSRDLTTAADLAVLTANDKLVLAPNAGEVLDSRRVASTGTQTINMASALGAPPSNVGPRALPPGAPSAADQTWHLTMIGAQTANARGYTGAGVSVAVGDTGFDINNDALKNRIDLTRARNYIINTATTPYDPTYVDVQSLNDKHGSHVAGIIAAENLPGVDMRGVAYDSTIVPIRVIPAGSDAPDAVYASSVDDPLTTALDYFTSLSNVMVYNASYGPSPARTPSLSVWPVSETSEIAAVGRALATGKIIVAASGNERDDHPVAGLNPSGIGLYPYIQPTHANTGVYNDGGEKLNFEELLTQRGLIISVMSVGTNKQPAYYSNLCGVTASWCVAAPGGDQVNNLGVYSTVPDNTYAAQQGTSMAAPTVSGALAVLIQAYPSYNARDLARLLFSTTEDIGDPGVDKVFGYGLIRLDRATEPVIAPVDGGTVTIAANNTTYWSPPVSTGGSFTKAGDGVLTVAGITNVPGTVAVTQGTFAVDGTLNVTGTGHRLSIESDGILAGFGQINGDTSIAGVLSPGKMPNAQDQSCSNSCYVINSPGTLTFNGNVTLQPTANTAIAVDGNLNVPGGPGTFSRIVVNGQGNAFTANGTLTPILRGIAGGVNNYTPGLGTQFKIVDAQNGAIAQGNFTSLIQPADGLPVNRRFDVNYEPTWIALVVTPESITAELSDKHLSADQRAVANLVERLRPDSGAAVSNATERFFDALYTLNSNDAYATAFRQLAGPGQPASPRVAMGALSGFTNTVASRQAAMQSAAPDVQADLAPSTAIAFDGSSVSLQARQAAAESAFASLTPAPNRPSTDQWSIWGRAFGAWSTVDAQNGTLGAKASGGGFGIGADRLLAPDLVGGLAFSFARWKSTNDDGSARYDSYNGALYATWTPGPFVVDMRGAIGTTKILTSRNTILTPSAITGSTTGLSAGGDIEVGYRISHGPFVTKPFAGLAGQLFRRQGYTETQEPFGLTFPTETFTKVTSALGVSNSILIRNNGWNLMPELRTAWAHNLRDTTLNTQAFLLGTPFTVTNVDTGRDAALVGLTLTSWTRDSFRLFASYNGEYRSRARSHEASAGVRIVW